MTDKIATIEASLAEAKTQAEANKDDSALAQKVTELEAELAEAKTPPVDPAKQELDKVKGKKLSKEERLLFAKKKIDEQLVELGIGDEPEEDDSKPVTLGDLKRIEKEKQKVTALELAQAIEDETERDLVLHQLENNITNGDPQERLKIARGYVNSLRNAQIAEEAQRKERPKGQSSAPGSPGKTEDRFEPTSDEQVFMSPPYNMTKDDIIKARKESAQKGE